MTNFLATEAAFTPPITQTLGPLPFVFYAANSTGCTSFPTGTFSGAIALIARGVCRFDTKVQNADNAGALGVVVYNNVVGAPPFSMGGDPRNIPAFMVGNAEGLALVDWYNTYTDTAKLQISYGTSRFPNQHAADVIASFSSRGPNIDLNIKPDVVAPGVDILSAEVNKFAVYQGTSMSAPHVTGAAALLKQLHPTWTPAQIKSALMTTAKFDGLYTDYGQTTPALVMDRGSGRIDLSQAGTSLTFDKPSHSFKQMAAGTTDSVTIQATNVTTPSVPVTYTLTISETGDITTTANFTASVSPTSLSIPAGATASFTLTMEIPSGATPADYEGQVNLSGSTDHHIPYWVRVTPAPTGRILLLDGDFKWLSDLYGWGWGEYSSYYTSTLNALGVAYDYTDGYVSLASMQQYEAIIWFTGDNYYVNWAGLTDNLKQYLLGGGRIFATGQDLSSVAGGTFTYALLGATVVQDGIYAGGAGLPSAPSLQAVVADPAFGGMVIDISGAGGGAANQLWVDELDPYDGQPPHPAYEDLDADTIFVAIGGKPQADATVGLKKSSEPTLEEPRLKTDYRVIFLGFGLEGMNTMTGTTPITLTGKVLDWLDDEVSVSISDGWVAHPYDLMTLTASANSTITGTTFIEYRWDFGDGSPIATTTVPTVTHSYGAFGVYQPRVEVTDSLGHKAVSAAGTATVGYRIFMPVVVKNYTP